MDTKHETEETQETPSPAAAEKLSPKGMRAMQGVETAPTASESEAASESDQPPAPKLDESQQINLDEEWRRTHDPANWEYKFGSPYADYQAYKDIEAAERRHELGQQAATADSLGEVVANTASAYKESQRADETPMDQYFREKYGSHPYTTEAYPKD